MYLKQDFHRVVIENQKWLLRYVMHFVKNIQTAEDIVQEVFIRAYKNYDGYIETGKVKNWLSTIARNASLRYLGDSAKQNCISLFTPIDASDNSPHLADILPDTDIPIEEQIAEDELSKQILRAIDKLPDQQRQVVYLRYIKDFSVTEVASLTQQPAGSVKSKSYYGLEKVRNYLSNYLVNGEYIMECKESYALLYQYAKVKILPYDRERLENHLSVCKECRNIAESLKVLVPYIKPAEGGEVRHYLIAISLQNGQTLYYFGSYMFFDNYEEINKILEENNGYIPQGVDWGLVGGHDDNFEHIAEFDNDGNRIEFELIPNSYYPNNVRVKYKRLKQVYPEFINTSVGLRKEKLFTPLLEDPNLMIGRLQNHLGTNGKSGIYLGIPGNGKNVRIKKGNGVIDAGSYKFAYSDRYVTEDETIKLECSYLKK